MLLSLHVKNFALIEKLSIELGKGFHILSGETGAGKSILVQAFEVLLGGRAYVEFIREGEDEAEVSGLFKHHGEEVSLRRVLTRSGKSRAYLNERPVTVQVLEEMSRELVDLVSQHEHQVLLQPEEHLSLLDEYAHSESLITSYKQELHGYRSLLNEKSLLQNKEKEARDREDFFRFQLREITEAHLQTGEEEDLQKEKEILKHAVKIAEISQKGELVIESSEESLVSTLARYLKELGGMVEVDPVLENAHQKLEECLAALQDMGRVLGRHGESVTADPQRLEEIESRLHLISRLKKKYVSEVSEILEKKKQIEESLNLLDSFEAEIQRVDQKILEKAKKLLSEAKKLHLKREDSAKSLSKALALELSNLGFKSAKIEFQLIPARQGHLIGENYFHENGMDEGEFLFAPNTGEGFKPLARIASGGEVSRIFLAIKKVLGVYRTTATYIFDEVDTGVGGGVAEVVGKSLSSLAHNKQVICVTHLPQIACFSDHHFVISKTVSKGRTFTEVRELSAEEQVEELARMLAGVKVTEKALAHAREMIQSARHE